MVLRTGFMGNLNVAMNAAIIWNAKSHLKIEVANLLKLYVFFGCGGAQSPLLASEFCAADVNPVELSVPALYRRDPR